MVLAKDKKILFIILGVLIGLASLFLPLKLIIFLVGGITAVIFTFFCLEISFGAFIAFMTIVPHEMWNNVLIMLAAFFYLFVFYVQVLQGKRKGIPLKNISLPLIFFVFFALYSVFISRDLGDSLRMFMILLSCIILSIVLMGMITDKKTINIIVSFICISIGLTCLYGLYQKYTGIEIRSEFIDLVMSANMPGRVFSTMNNPNNYAEYLVLVLPLCLSYFLNSKNELKKLVLIGIFGLGTILLVLTLSRASYVAFALGTLFYILLLNRRLLPFCIILAVLAIPFMPDFVIYRLMSIGKDSSSSYRFLIWEGVFNILRENFVQGIGMGPSTFKKVYFLYANRNALNALHSHNLILNVLVEMGIGGFISFILLLLSSLKNNFTAFLKTEDKYFKNMLAAFVFSLVGITFFSSVEYVWFYPRVMLTFWLVLGLSFGTINLARGEN